MTTSRRAANRQAWADRVERFQSSNQSVAEFCASEGIAPASFYQWRRKLRRVTEVALTGPRFVPVQLTSESTLEPQKPPISTVMSVEFPGGVRVRFELAGGQEAQP